MAVYWALLAAFALAVLHIPPTEGYRNGARVESCYNMGVEHLDPFPSPGRIAPAQVCGDPCFYGMVVAAQVDEISRVRTPGADLSTYQCGQVYESKLLPRI